MSVGNIQDSQFLFIDVKGVRTKAQQRRIRQQAMKKTAESRKKLGSAMRVNVGQYPVFAHPATNCANNGQGGFVEVSVAAHEACDLSTREVLLLQSPSPTGYERSRAAFKLDLVSLSNLTSFHFSRASAQLLSEDQNRIITLLRAPREHSYLEFVPRLYERNSLVSAVVDCTLARASQTLHGRSAVSEFRVLSLYGRAIEELRVALKDSTRMLNPDVLCAMQMMALYELLNYSAIDSWQNHTGGMIRLLELRGIQRYETEFEKCLISSAIGTVYSESMLANMDCFLAKPQWKSLLMNLAIPSTSHNERSPEALELWGVISCIPGLFKAITDYILHAKLQDAGLSMSLLLRCYETRHQIITWRERYSHEQIYTFREDFAISLASQCMLQRLMIALSPRSEDACDLEVEVQELASHLMNLSEELLALRQPQSNLLVAQKRVIAIAMQQSASQAKSVVDFPFEAAEPGRSHIRRSIFREWSDQLGRQLT